MAATTASARGKAARAKGIKAERDLGAYLRGNGWPEAERGRNNGFRTREREGKDGYDIAGTPGLLWDAKDVADDELWRIPGWLEKLVTDARAAGLLGLLVVKRRGRADAGLWWCWAMAGDLFGGGAPVLQVPVCLELRHAALLLRRAGYGEPLVPEQTLSSEAS